MSLIIDTSSISQPLQCNIARKQSKIYLPDLLDQICQPVEPQNWFVRFGFRPADLIERSGWHHVDIRTKMIIVRKSSAMRHVKDDLHDPQVGISHSQKQWTLCGLSHVSSLYTEPVTVQLGGQSRPELPAPVYCVGGPGHRIISPVHSLTLPVEASTCQSVLNIRGTGVKQVAPKGFPQNGPNSHFYQAR